MRIAYISDTNPSDINNWSGTPFHIVSALKEQHEVVWVGGGLIKGALWHHRFLHRKERFNVLDYISDICRIVSDTINNGNFDIAISATYSMCSELHINIPLIAFSDLTYSLCCKYLRDSTPYRKVLSMHEEEKFLRQAGAIIYSSDFACKSALSDYDIPSEKIHLIEFGANIPDPEDVNLEENDTEVCRLLFVGRNWEKKGGPKALESFRLLKKSGFNCELTVIGCHPPKDAKDEGLTVIPWLDKSHVVDLIRYDTILRKSHFMILPTVFDAYGIVFCEASAYGIPSIAANVGGVGQPVREGKNGFLLSPDATAQDYANIIRSIFLDKDRYSQLRYSSRQEYKDRLNWEVWASRVTKIMEELVNQNRMKESTANSNNEMSSTERLQESSNLFYIPVYAFNLKSRTDRLKSIQKQFSDRKEFKVTYMEAVYNKIGAVGLWQSIRQAVKLAIKRGEDLIILCEDDHIFTETYNYDYLLSNIAGAYEQGAELLNGGIGGFGTAVPVSANRSCVDWFWSTQFVVLFEPIFNKILKYDFKDTDTADGVLSVLAQKAQVLYPPVSTQANFGYSDIAVHRDQAAFQNKIFTKANQRLYAIHKLYADTMTPIRKTV